MALTVNIQLLLSTNLRTVFEIHVNYKLYLGVGVYDADFASEFPAEAVEDIGDLRSRETLWVPASGS